MERRRRLANQIAEFVHGSGRKKRPGGLDPNDRQYDCKLEATVKQLDPRELDELLRGDFDQEG